MVTTTCKCQRQSICHCPNLNFSLRLEGFNFHETLLSSDFATETKNAAAAIHFTGDKHKRRRNRHRRKRNIHFHSNSSLLNFLVCLMITITSLFGIGASAFVMNKHNDAPIHIHIRKAMSENYMLNFKAAASRRNFNWLRWKERIRTDEIFTREDVPDILMMVPQGSHDEQQIIQPDDENKKVVKTTRTSTSTRTLPEISQIPSGIKLSRKRKQKRRPYKRPRRPSAYWSDISNVEEELRSFWMSVNVGTDIVSASLPPSIPNEALLNHFERHDLRYAIANMGGRERMAEKLGGARLIPGQWHVAIRQSKEVQCLLRKDNPSGAGLSRAVPPIAPHVKRTLVRGEVQRVKTERKKVHDDILGFFLSPSDEMGGNGNGNGNGNNWDRPNDELCSIGNKDDDVVDDDDVDDIDYEVAIANMDQDILSEMRYPQGERWAHQETRNPRGYWDEDVVISELHSFLKCLQEGTGRPAVWMAQLSEIGNEGRNDLRLAISRYGGAVKICALAGLVPYKEWRYFESQLELFIELHAYLQKYDADTSIMANKNMKTKQRSDGGKLMFPRLADIANNGHGRLYDLVMDFGGRKIIAIKLNMNYQAQTKDKVLQGMSFGNFDLTFAIRLMYYIRKEMLECDPIATSGSSSLSSSETETESMNSCNSIQMPTIKELLQNGEKELAKDVLKYGGHESIARRLNLNFDHREAKRDAIGNR